jgi:hypothetical protein
MRGRRGWRIAVATLVAVAGVAGCGGSSGGGGSAKDGVLTGFDGVAKADRLTTTIRLDATPADLRSLSQASGDTLDPHLASVISGADIVIESVRADGGTSLDVSGVAGGSTLVEFRSLGGTLYLHGDVRGILTLIDKKSVFANLKSQTKSMPSFVQAVVNGQWVSLPASALTSVASLGGGQSSASGDGARLLTELRRSIERHATVSEVGHDSRGTHYVLHADTRDLANDLRTAAQTAVPGGGLLSSRLPSNVSHQTVTFDAWVRSGAVSQVSIDLLQFGDNSKLPSGSTLPLTITFDRTGQDIAAPTGATPVDLTQLGTLFGALTGGG